ncbi:putative cell cycle control protein cwf18 [Emericellopsis atlantica]|uniref:Cell cycle control protein cwf18 n=1 Tax=Emericellopsis atlantica TaxID=2614577 RepID=A0A9P8CP82_9HYPO|nr:putative cell cycle control protein cwf18 [Emericellopsis atlantica]KAG9254579.1 putative cell cycle control protein cwf18 [Emericellopsis atlantica]
MSSQSNLSAAADDRKARLANLRNLKRKQPTDEIVAPESTRSPSPPAPEKDLLSLHLSGRNYDPETRGPKLGFETPPTLAEDKSTLEEQAAQLEEEARLRAEEAARDDKGIDLFKLQPKKPNWDLKRDLEKKMEILNVRTDNAIARLVRERIAAAQQAKKKTNGLEKDKMDGEAAGVDGVTLVEGLRMREKEEEEEERREKAEAEAENVA